MTFSGNSTGGLDQGQDIPDDDPGGWECEACGHVFFVASASSIEDCGEIVPGVTCPECGEFVFTDEDGDPEWYNADDDSSERQLGIFGSL